MVLDPKAVEHIPAGEDPVVGLEDLGRGRARRGDDGGLAAELEREERAVGVR